MNNLNELPLLIRTLRKASGLTQAQLAELAGVGKTLVFDIEHGSTSISLENLKKILKVLNTDILFKAPLDIHSEKLK